MSDSPIEPTPQPARWNSNTLSGLYNNESGLNNCYAGGPTDGSVYKETAIDFAPYAAPYHSNAHNPLYSPMPALPVDSSNDAGPYYSSGNTADPFYSADSAMIPGYAPSSDLFPEDEGGDAALPSSYISVGPGEEN